MLVIGLNYPSSVDKIYLCYIFLDNPNDFSTIFGGSKPAFISIIFPTNHLLEFCIELPLFPASICLFHAYIYVNIFSNNGSFQLSLEDSADDIHNLVEC